MSRPRAENDTCVDAETPTQCFPRLPPGIQPNAGNDSSTGVKAREEVAEIGAPVFCTLLCTLDKLD